MFCYLEENYVYFISRYFVIECSVEAVGLHSYYYSIYNNGRLRDLFARKYDYLLLREVIIYKSIAL